MLLSLKLCLLAMHASLANGEARRRSKESRVIVRIIIRRLLAGSCTSNRDSGIKLEALLDRKKGERRNKGGGLPISFFMAFAWPSKAREHRSLQTGRTCASDELAHTRARLRLEGSFLSSLTAYRANTRLF